ncbi:unnamed protein product, partial [Rotaria sordida]
IGFNDTKLNNSILSNTTNKNLLNNASNGKSMEGITVGLSWRRFINKQHRRPPLKH